MKKIIMMRKETINELASMDADGLFEILSEAELYVKELYAGTATLPTPYNRYSNKQLEKIWKKTFGESIEIR